MISLPAPYPWQEAVWLYIQRCRDQQRLPQALLLSGPDGVGKRELADKIASLLLCEKQSLCASCQACLLLASGSHPDLYTLSPDAGSRVIRIDAVRNLIRALACTGAQGLRQCVILDTAHALHPAAANAFLKTLEEPAGAVTMILVTSRPNQMLPAIRSRCQQWRIAPPNCQQFAFWWGDRPSELPLAALQEICSNIPLLAKDFFVKKLQEQCYRSLGLGIQALLDATVDPVVLAKQCLAQEPDLVLCLSRMNVLVGLMLRESLGIRSDYLAAIGVKVGSVSALCWVRWLDAIHALRRVVEEQRITLAAELQLVGIFSLLLDVVSGRVSTKWWGYAQ